MPHLTEAECNQIISLFKGGTIRNHIIETLDFSKTTVYRTIQTFCEGK
ncbi:7112_t:CDS:1, partial [Funneliformis caledonium]